MQKRIIIHIGTHKTGTTTLQSVLHQLRPVLLERGVLYPRTDRDHSERRGPPKQAELAQLIRTAEPPVLAQARQRLVDEFEASGAHSLVISAEGLSGPSPAAANFFAPLSTRYRLEVICYLRRQDLFVESLFNQITKRSDRMESRDIVQFVNDARTQERLDYNAMLRNWRKLPAHITAVDFAKAVRSPGLVPSFLQALGVADVTVPDSVRNRSLDMRLIMTLVALNRVPLNFNEARLLRATEEIQNQTGFVSQKHVLGTTLRQQLLQQCADGNRRLARRYGVRFDTTLPNEGLAPMLHPDPGFLLALLGQLSQRGQRATDALA